MCLWYQRMLINASIFWYSRVMHRRGFTIVEIIITITVMGILLGLAFVNLSSSELRARDSERKADVEAFKTHLESYYESGSDVADSGSYPSTTLTTSEASVREALRDIDFAVVTAPGSSGVVNTLQAATNADTSVSGVLPQPMTTQYVYQPLSWNGSSWALCTGASECRRYNIYYRLEEDNIVYKVTSTHQ